MPRSKYHDSDSDEDSCCRKPKTYYQKPCKKNLQKNKKIDDSDSDSDSHSASGSSSRSKSNKRSEKELLFKMKENEKLAERKIKENEELARRNRELQQRLSRIESDPKGKEELDKRNKELQEKLALIESGPIYKKAIIQALNYSCPITLDDTSSTGGYRLLEHRSKTDIVCSPMFVLSETGYMQLIHSQEKCVCPVCYAKLNENNFEKVPPSS